MVQVTIFNKAGKPCPFGQMSAQSAEKLIYNGRGKYAYTTDEHRAYWSSMKKEYCL